MKLLDANQIRQKTERLAIEIAERNYGEGEIILAGINRNGWAFAERIHNAMITLPDAPIVRLAKLSLNPANPLAETIGLDLAPEEFANKIVIVIDDVANTGRTLFYAMKPFFAVLPKKIEVAVLVDRRHKSFPVQADYYGLTLATTVKENIEVRIRDVAPTEEAVYLN